MSAPTPPSPSGVTLLKKLWPMARPDGHLYVASLVSAPLLVALNLAQPYLLKIAIDDYITVGQLDGLQTVALQYLGTVILGFGLNAVFGLATAVAGQRLIRRLREAILKHLLSLSPSWFDKRPAGELLTRGTSDVEALGETVSSGVVTIVMDALIVVATLGAMIWLDWRLTLALFLLAPPLVGVIEVCRRGLRRHFNGMREGISAVNSYLAERVGGVEILQLFSAEEASARRFRALNRPYARSTIRSNVYDALMYAAVDGVGSVAFALMLWYATSSFGVGVSAGLLVAFIEYVNRLFTPLKEFSGKIAILQRASTALDKIFSLLEENDHVPSGALALPKPTGSVRFQDVRFSYKPGPPEADILKGVSFEVKPGQVVAIVGATGCGKTTVTRLLSRTYAGYRGSITLDGVELSALRLPDVRRAVASVSQDVQIFPETVRFNIGLGDPKLTDARLMSAAELVCADTLVRGLPGGLDEPLKERGGNLSVGEAQLLTFARTMAYDPTVVILDEATASIDPVTERLIQRAIERILAEKTVIVIAHRLSTIQAADQIVVMHQGEVSQVGTHDQLLAMGGRYAELHAAGFSS